MSPVTATSSRYFSGAFNSVREYFFPTTHDVMIVAVSKTIPILYTVFILILLSFELESRSSFLILFPVNIGIQ
ncbi:hypothetical protein D3C80_1977200 [compost metagenome]